MSKITAYLTTVAEDAAVSMEEHDKQYHGGAFDPDTMKCSLRENDKADERLCQFKGRSAENEGVRSYVTKAVKDGKRWKEDRSKKDDHSQWISKGKHDKWYSIPDPKEASETPNLDSFADVSWQEDDIGKGEEEVVERLFPELERRLEEVSVD